MNACHACMLQDSTCQDCQDLKDARSADMAHELVDEGNLQYKHHWFLTTEPSGHDWTERDSEYKGPTVSLQDGGVLDNLWELDDLTQSKREIVCGSCHITTPKHLPTCQSCDKPVGVTSISLMNEIVKYIK